MTKETVLTSARYYIEDLKRLTDKLETRTTQLYECADICSKEKLVKYWELINEAVNKADEAYRMGMREDN